MKKTLLIKRIILYLASILFLVQTGNGQVLLDENFDYTAGSLLTANGWTAHSGAGTQPVDVIVPGLTFTGYPSSNIGGAAQVDNNGEDVNRVFTAQSSGTVYAAFMLNVVAPVDGYFLHLGGNPIGTTFRAKLFTIGTTSPFNFGLSVGGNTATPVTGGSYTTGTTYLCVIKYEIISGASNDIVSMFIITGSVPSVEPVTPTIGPLTDATMADIFPASIALRQFSALQNYQVDGIRVATSWADAISDVNPPSAAFNPANSATNVPVSVIPIITFDEPVRKTDGSALTDGDLASLLTFKKTDASGTSVAFTATIDAAKKIITITPSSALDNSQLYYLAVGPGKDIYGNESVTKISTFTTIALLAPTITVVYPNGGEVMYAGDLKTITWTTTNFGAGENVKVEVWAIDGETGLYFWLVLEPSTPNDGAYDVVVGPDAQYGTGYLIRLSGVTNGASDVSDGPFTIISVATDLAHLRQYAENTVIKYTGTATVTYSRSSYNQKYIEDATAAVLVHDPSGFIAGTYNIGDGIKNIEGKITLYNGLIELVPLAATGEPATGTAIVPPVVNIASLTADDQCKLVKVEKLRFANPFQWDATNGLFVSGKNYDLEGLSNINFAYRTNFFESDYLGTPVPSQYFNAVVLVGQFNAQMQVTARNLADITLLSPAKAITSFALNSLIPSVTGTIDEGTKTVSLTVPSGTDVSALVPTIAISDKAAISPLSGVAGNFTSPVMYTVTAEDGTTAMYTVTVSVLTGIDKNSIQDVILYPVPVTSELRLRNVTNLKSIDILDATGRVISSLSNNSENEVTIPVSGLKHGIYFIRLNDGKTIAIRKFIK